MKSYLTKRDKEIIKFVEKHHSITITLCNKIFIPSKSGYKIAQRRLNKMVECEQLKVYKPRIGEENVYYIDRKLSQHDLLILYFYAELINCGAKNIYFEKKKKWLNGDIESDAFFQYEYGGYMNYNILEICHTHKKIPISNYEELFKTNEVQKICMNTFPRIIVVDDVEHINPDYYHSELFKIIQINSSLNNLPLIFID